MVTVRYRYTLSDDWTPKAFDSLQAAYEWLATMPEDLAWVVES